MSNLKVMTSKLSKQKQAKGDDNSFTLSRSVLIRTSQRMREMKFLCLSRTSSSCLFIIKNLDHTKSLGFLMTQTPYEFRDHDPL